MSSSSSSSSIISYEIIDSSRVFCLASKTTINGREIRKYLLNDHAQETLVKAAKAVHELLSQNHQLCAAFDTGTIKAIELKLSKKRYLTINGFAVCLSKNREAPGGPSRDYKDRYFSETLLKEPVSCSRGHFLEKKYVEFWVDKNGDECPARGHRIGEIKIDEELQRDIQRYKKEKAKTEKYIQSQKLKELENAFLKYEKNTNRRIIELLKKKLDPRLMAGAGTKLVVKTIGKKTCKAASGFLTRELAKEGSKRAAKFGAQNIAKIVPGVSVGVGVTLAIYRCSKQDDREYVKAVGEVLSGIAACWPGLGTAASFGIDILLAGDDILESFNEVEITLEFDLKGAYECLRIDTDKQPEPTKEQVDKAYRKCVRIVHPDACIGLGKYYSSPMTELTSKVNKIRDAIYHEHAWDSSMMKEK